MIGPCMSDEKRKAKQLEMKLKADYEASMSVIKLLLLGAAEGGKSTILKQLKILHNDGYTTEELLKYRPTVYQNIAVGIQSIVDGMRTLDIKFRNPKNEVDAALTLAETILQSDLAWFAFSPELIQAIIGIWHDRAVQEEVLPRSNEFQFMESTPYFMDSIERIAAPDYVPSVQDILMLRVHTTGVVEIKFAAKQRQFNVYDVGGQRSERRKWIHCFDQVNAVIFVVALSEFDQLIGEDMKTKRMVESMRLFRSVCNSRFFFNTAMILFLNKRDLFLKKVCEGKTVKLVFKDYHGGSGPETYADQVSFVKEKFASLNLNPNKQVYTHETCATDTNQIELVLDNVIDLLSRALFNSCVLA